MTATWGAFEPVALAKPLQTPTVPPTRICLRITSQVQHFVLEVDTLEEEVNRIWQQYGIEVEGLREPCDPADADRTVQVRIRRIVNGRQPIDVPPDTLGSIYFAAGVPGPLIDVWVDQALRIMDANPTSLLQGFHDLRLRHEVSVLLARSLAHELGHYLLASTSHTETGLMRVQFTARDARPMDGGRFELNAAQIASLARRVASWTREPAPAPVATTDAGTDGDAGAVLAWLRREERE